MLRERPIANLVVDPVMVTKSGDPLLRPDARHALVERILPLALVVTPNLPEAGALADAVEQYKKAVEMGPAFIDLRYRLARLMLDAGNPLGAREELERVLQARPGRRRRRASPDRVPTR